MSLYDPYDEQRHDSEFTRGREDGDAIEEKYRQRELEIERQNHELGLAVEAARRALYRLSYSDRDSRWMHYDDPRELEEAKYRNP